MKINRAKQGAIVEEKLHETYYLVSSTETNQDGDILSAEAFRIDMEKLREDSSMKDESDHIMLRLVKEIPTVGIDSIKILEENSICFRVIKDAKVSIRGDWEVKDGILLHDGKAAVEQGSLEVERILMILENKILLLFKTKEEGLVKLGVYDPSYYGREFSFPITYPISIPEVTLLENEDILLTYTRSHWEEIEDSENTEDNKDRKKVEVFDDAGYIKFTSDGNLQDYQNCDEPLGHLVTYTRKFLVFQGEFKGKPISTVVKRELYDVVSWDLTVTGKIMSAKESSNGLFIKTEDSFVYIGADGYKKEVSASKKLSSFFANQLKGYDYVVDYKEGNNRSNFVLTLATEDYKVHSLSGSYTRDLGLVLKLEK